MEHPFEKCDLKYTTKLFSQKKFYNNVNKSPFIGMNIYRKSFNNSWAFFLNLLSGMNQTLTKLFQSILIKWLHLYFYPKRFIVKRKRFQKLQKFIKKNLVIILEISDDVNSIPIFISCSIHSSPDSCQLRPPTVNRYLERICNLYELNFT